MPLIRRAKLVLLVSLALAPIAQAAEPPALATDEQSDAAKSRTRPNRRLPGSVPRAPPGRSRSVRPKLNARKISRSGSPSCKTATSCPGPSRKPTRSTRQPSPSRARCVERSDLTLSRARKLYETEHFLVVSNIPAEQVAPYVASLDKMYEWMCQLYGVPRDHKVWLGGKAPIFAFLEQGPVRRLRGAYLPGSSRVASHAREHLRPVPPQKDTGEVAIACYRGNDPNDFAQMLVHETSHGFIHRYKTKAPLPNWVDEGMADLIGAEMVPASTVVKNREYKGDPAARPADDRSAACSRPSGSRPGNTASPATSTASCCKPTARSYVRFIERSKRARSGRKPSQSLRQHAERIAHRPTAAGSTWPICGHRHTIDICVCRCLQRYEFVSLHQDTLLAPKEPVQVEQAVSSDARTGCSEASSGTRPSAVQARNAREPAKYVLPRTRV